MKMRNNLVKILKRRLAAFVAFTLIVTMVLPYAGNIGVHLVSTDTAYAAIATETELRPEILPRSSNDSNSTTYYWQTTGYSDQDWTQNGVRLDFIGKVSRMGGFPTTFKSAGFEFKALVTDAEIGETADSSGAYIEFSREGANDGSDANGAVYWIKNNPDDGGGVEIKVTTTPSVDKKYMLLDLYAYNRNSVSKYLNLRMTADTLTDGNDAARVYINSDQNIIHMGNDNWFGGSYEGTYFRSLDIIGVDNNIKLTPFNVAWAGMYYSRSNPYNAWQFLENYRSAGDAGVSLGWKNILLKPYDFAHRRVGILARTSTLYVNSVDGIDRWIKPGDHPSGIYRLNADERAMLVDDDGADHGAWPGSYDNPLKTVSYALARAKENGWKKCYICLQTDCKTDSISITDSDMDVTFQSTDLTKDCKRNEELYTLKIDSNVGIDITCGRLTFQDIIVDGQNYERTKPFITQTNNSSQHSYVIFGSGSVFKNFKNKQGAAVINTKPGYLYLYGTEIDNCISKDVVTGSGATLATKSNCAITFEGTGIYQQIEVNGVNKIYNNFNTDGKKANVYLADDKMMQVTNLLRNEDNTKQSRISVKTEKLPDAFIGNVENANQEVIVAKPTSSYPEIDGTTVHLSNILKQMLELLKIVCQ